MLRQSHTRHPGSIFRNADQMRQLAHKALHLCFDYIINLFSQSNLNARACIAGIAIESFRALEATAPPADSPPVPPASLKSSHIYINRNAFFSFARSCGAAEAEAEDAVVAEGGVVPVAIGGTAEPRVAVPTAAAQDTVAARRCITWIIHRTLRIIVAVVPVLTPLTDIAHALAA